MKKIEYIKVENLKAFRLTKQLIGIKDNKMINERLVSFKIEVFFNLTILKIIKMLLVSINA